jgi:O-antigen/teichoic acid export membrane protein
MTSVRRALALSMIERYLLVLLTLGSNMVLARLLTPEEIGLYAVALAVIGLMHMVREFGIGAYLIQEPDLQPRHVHTAFGVSLLLGSALFLALFAAGPAAGRFYADGRVGEALRIVAINFLVLPFCSISTSLLRRKMRFDSLAIAALSGGVAGAAVTLSLAWAGYGPNSLAVGSVVSNVAIGIAAWWALRDPAVFRPALSEWRAVLSFGGQSALTNVVASASNNINDLALAKVLGFAPVAMISRAQGLPAMFQRELMRSVQVVAFPAFAKVHREGGSVELRWTAAVGALTVLGWPFFGFAALMALELMRLMFGTQWDEAARLVPLFCAAGAVMALSGLIQQLLVAMGRIDLNTRFELSFQPLRALAIVLVAVYTRSLEACAWVFLVSAVLYTPILYAVKTRCSRFDWPALAAQLRASLWVSLLSLALPAGVCLWYGLDRAEPMPVWVFVGVVLGTAVSWVAALLWVKHPVSDDPAFVKLLKKLRLR